MSGPPTALSQSATRKRPVHQGTKRRADLWQVLESFETLIRDTYHRLGHRWGWRFLASPARTLSPETRLAFVGLNPGGARYEPPQVSVEEGNAYRVERWGPGRSLNRLQVQMGCVYDAIASRSAADASAAELMDGTLAGNFCPFRSPGWQQLTNRSASVRFSRALWSDVLEIAHPRVLICFGTVNDYLAGILERGRSRYNGTPEIGSVGWGDVTYSLTHYEGAIGKTLLVPVPHLSRFGIFGRPQSPHAVDRVCVAIVEAAFRRPDALPLRGRTRQSVEPRPRQAWRMLQVFDGDDAGYERWHVAVRVLRELSLNPPRW
jgi:hypothetical protein